MKKIMQDCAGKILGILSLLFVFVHNGKAQSSINMSTANCTISANEVQMDVLVTNTGTIDLRWNSCVLRMTVPASMIPAGGQTYTYNYLRGSDFPLSFPAIGNNSFGGNYTPATGLLTWTTGNTSAYNNSTCSAPLITPGQTKMIGRFSFKITSSIFVPGATANFVWHTTSSCNFYQTCTPFLTAYNQSSGIRALTNPCTLIVPGGSCSTAASTTTTTGVSCLGNDGAVLISLSDLSANEQGTYILDGGTAQSFTTNPFIITGLAAGNHMGSVSGSFSTLECPVIPLVFNIASSTPIAATYIKNNTSTCNGTDLNTGSITVSPAGTGSFTYSWSGPNGYTGNTATITGLAAGSYNVIFTAANSCTGSVSNIQITASNIITVNNNGSVLGSNCSNNGSISLNGTGGQTPYSYSLDGVNYQPGNTFNNLAAGVYTGYIKDANGCTGTKSMTIIPVSIDVITTGSILNTCTNTGSIVLSGNAGTPPYTFSLNGTTYQPGNSFTNLSIGSYTGYVKDVNGCIGIKSISIAQTQINISRTTGSTSSPCVNNATEGVVADGGTPPYSFSLDGINYITVLPAQQFANYQFTNLGPGNYTVYVKDAGGCANSRAFSIGSSGYPYFRPTIGASSSCINNGYISMYASATFQAYPPFSYSLDGVNFQSSNVFSNLAAGTYTGYVRDVYGCSGPGTQVVVPQIAPVTLTARHSNASTCLNNGTIQADDPSGGTAPFTYSLDGTTFQASKSFAGLAAGTYTLTAKDSKGCLGTVSVNITQNAINVTSYAWNASSCATTNGKIQLFLTGGFSPYSYSIDGVTYQTSNLFTNLSAATYAGYVKDAAGCVGMKTGIVVGPTGCSAPFAGSNVSNSKLIAEAKSAELRVRAFPNPSENEFTLVLNGYNNTEKILITVTDILGRKIYQADGISKSQYIFGKNFKAGVYIAEVVQGNDKKTIKLIKE